MLLNRGDVHVVESERTSITGNPSLLLTDLTFSLPIAMKAVANPSASIAEEATTVAEMTSVETGRPVNAEIVCP